MQSVFRAFYEFSSTEVANKSKCVIKRELLRVGQHIARRRRPLTRELQKHIRGKLKEVERQQITTGGRESEGWERRCERGEGESAEQRVENDCR